METPESSVSEAEVAAEATVNLREKRLFGCSEEHTILVVAEMVQAKKLRF